LKAAGSPEAVKEEMGDLIFALVNVARMKGVEPEDALQECSDKFTRRFNFIEDRIAENRQTLGEVPLEAMDELWNEAKKRGL
ncbi:MAG: MazG nucleotide pyrophosphohydrolase domain-containing protein, partial [Syntrophomonas sp.]